jgi:hypothetical protein
MNYFRSSRIKAAISHLGRRFHVTFVGAGVVGAAFANDFLPHLSAAGFTLWFGVIAFMGGWKAGNRSQTFDADGHSVVLNQNLDGKNNGICISYTFVADRSGTKNFTITPSASSTFHLYGLANCAVPLGNYSLTARVIDNSGSGSLSSGLNLQELRAPENPATTVAGMNYNYHEGDWSSLPDFSILTPVEIASAGTRDLSVRNRDEHFGLVFSGLNPASTADTDPKSGLSKLRISASELPNGQFCLEWSGGTNATMFSPELKAGFYRILPTRS